MTWFSALTLAGAAERVLSDKQREDGLLGVDAFSIRSMINLHISEEYHREAAKYFRRDYDFFRHADRKPQEDDEFSEEWVDFLLFLAIGGFEFLGQKKSDEMWTYINWFAMKYPERLSKDGPFTPTMLAMKENA